MARETVQSAWYPELLFDFYIPKWKQEKLNAFFFSFSLNPL